MDTSNADVESYDGILTQAERRTLKDVANDADYARKISAMMSSALDLPRIDASRMPKSIGDPGYDPAYNDAFFRQQNALQATTSEVSARRSARIRLTDPLNTSRRSTTTCKT